MMAFKVTPPLVEVEGAEEDGGIAKVAGSVGFIRGHFGRSWASLYRTEPTLVVPMVVKKGEEGMGINKCLRIHVIVEGKMSLSRVAVSKYTSRIDVMK